MSSFFKRYLSINLTIKLLLYYVAVSFVEIYFTYSVGEDEIPEEIEGASDSSSEKNEAMAVKVLILCSLTEI